MRRSDRQITDGEIIKDFLQSNNIIRLAFNTEDAPYILPLSYGFDYDGNELIFYFHGAESGRKVDLAKEKPLVGFEIDSASDVKKAEKPCSFSIAYKSIIGSGILSIVEDTDEKNYCLNRIMFHFSGNDLWEFPEKMFENTTVFKLIVEDYTMKSNMAL